VPKPVRRPLVLGVLGLCSLHFLSSGSDDMVIDGEFRGKKE
jgi:hypothetical protein